MPTRPPIRWLTLLAFLASLGTGCGPSHPAHGASRALESPWVAPVPSMPGVAVAPLTWCAIERRVRRGVLRGVASYRFDLADRDEVAAIAMERAWRAFSAAEEPIRHPEAWGKTIAVRVGLDELRRQRRERLRLDLAADPELVGDSDLLEEHRVGSLGPLEEAVEAERRELLGRRLDTWPAAERRLAQLLLDGSAETVTAAAWLYRAEEEARGGSGTMYPQKARGLLDARRGELEDLV